MRDKRKDYDIPVFSAASLGLQQESSNLLQQHVGHGHPSHTMFLCATGGCQPYLCGSVTPRTKDALVEIIDSCSFQSAVDINTPEVNTSFRLPSTVPLRPRNVCVRRAETVKASPVTQCKTTEENRTFHLTLLPRHRTFDHSTVWETLCGVAERLWRA